MAGNRKQISLLGAWIRTQPAIFRSSPPTPNLCAKAKLGAAFQFEPEAEAESNKKQLQSKLEKSHRKESAFFLRKSLRVSYDIL